jgi:hypothetical protein
MTGLGRWPGMLQARSGHDGAIDAMACLAADGDDILTCDPGGLRALTEAAGIPRRPHPVGATWQPNPHGRPPEPVLRCPGSAMAAVLAWLVAGSSKVSGANEFWEPSGEPTWTDIRRRQATSSHGSCR